ncbi:hypothetical protein TM239_56290 [Bradyrhizobium sp. TM239]|nr:hypothetical protein TM233_52920 [Bradyrhizobium sp. TM233]GMP09738.1 hypothetical protein TM239_56290 [Bradyrhizobium sp. TM239]
MARGRRQGWRWSRSLDGAQRNPGSCRDETAPDYAALHPGYRSEAAPLPKRGHLLIGSELASIRLIKAFENGCPMLLRDVEDLTL